ncbi:myotubularin-related protein 13-like isoform X3 [Amphibalanus amphitrite]|uniref:myotubularin-related protein 13-like isoform X3 n=1 Tax=Amphibalanus amphitrite TaxID=1232801 RepID=UPI001C91E160|nr:myotubularin-related protein 13-like isoform X3 [Amphibalanus amphitrite]
MSRLADYFVVVGYNHEKDKQGVSCGKILQRFPVTDWDDTAFIDGIELFCQPQGWALSTERLEPRFFVSVLTDVDAERHYCACLTFNETVTIQPSKPVDEEEETFSGERNGLQRLPTITHHSVMYAPKALVLVSRLDYFVTFRNCLGILYAVYMDSLGPELEALVGNILGCVQVPPPGGPQVRFSIGAGDRQALQPPLSPSIPTTGVAVAQLFGQLGIKNVMTLFCAAMTEHKILVHSTAYSRLTEACHALTSLMYPFKYSYVYIPVLPSSLLEVVTTPTPFIMGAHSSVLHGMPDLMDVIVADLDGGCVSVPESCMIPQLPEPVRSLALHSLSQVLHPELHRSDFAFPTPVRPSAPMILDKEIRAVFLRMFGQLLQGYRNCLTLIRIHPTPVITFHKASFLGQRGMVDCSFTARLLDCMFFTSFIAERGPPWRPCDIFDEVYCGVNEMVRQETADRSLTVTHVQELAQNLYNNEIPSQQPYVEKIPRPTEGSFRRIHQPVFPTLNVHAVQQVIEEGRSKTNLKQSHASGERLAAIKPQPNRIVPMGPHISTLQQDGRQIVNNSARRLEVLRNCVSCIFESKISDARKSFPAVLRALKNKSARLALCHELSQHVIGNKAILDNEQFELVVRLMNCALQDDSTMDEHGVAAAILPLATAFCRRLCTGVIQFAYTCIQEHTVWGNLQFWEAAYYQDVQRDVQRLYAPRHEGRYGVIDATGSQFGSLEGDRDPGAPGWRPDRKTAEPAVLELAADQLRMRSQLEEAKLQELSSTEESTVYSQAIHYANRIVYLRVPLDVVSHRQRMNNYNERGESNSNSVTNSVADAETDSLTAESGFEDQEVTSAGVEVTRFVSRFVDKVCTEGHVTQEHIRQLHQMVPGVVAMHIETLEAVSKESKRLPSTKKPKILMPSLLPGEELLLEAVRSYLLPDGREEMTGALGGPAFLPAEGAFFITNYRLIFKGAPCDAFASELAIVRSLPISSLTKEKRISVQYLPHLDQWLQEGLQLRSNTFQLIKLAFDEEVTAESIERLKKLIQRLRAPPSIAELFAFRGQHFVAASAGSKDKQKNATLRGFAKKTLLRTARKAGLKTKASKRQKYVLSVDGRAMTSPGRMSLPPADSLEYLPGHEDELSVVDESEVSSQAGSSSSHLQTTPVESVSMERLTERSYYRDWQRLGLGQLTSSTLKRMEPFRVTAANSSYTICRSYPALLPLPCHISDISAAKVARCHRHGRLPVATWKHPRTRALLLRGSTFYGKGVRGIIMAHQATSSSSDTSVALEQEKYMSAVVAATPLSVPRPGSSWAGLSDSSLSIDSLVLQAASAQPDAAAAAGYPTLTPEMGRKVNPFSKAMNTLRFSPRSPDSEQGHHHHHHPVGGSDGAHTFQKASLYVFGDRAHIKTDSFPKTDFIPVEYSEVKQVKVAFKKLMRACVPSTAAAERDQTFLRAVEASEWLPQIQRIMQVAGAAVDLIDVQGSSVMLCLEDGWDLTAQISSVAQLCLDPYYRTLEGFRVLVEKEWLAFGHRFSHRSNLTQASMASGFAPIFLQFLDVVHQIQHQFPLSFEFNSYYLRLVAYHTVSSRFRTFLLDSELERVETGLMAAEDRCGSLSRHLRRFDPSQLDEDAFPGVPSGRPAGGSSSHGAGGAQQTQSVFDYIDRHAARSPLFHNFYYVPDTENPVLRPYCALSSLLLWDYYCGETLARGPSYDLEVVALDGQRQEETEAADGSASASGRRTLTAGYDPPHQLSDVFSYYLEEIHRLETELGHLPQQWKNVWDKMEVPNTDSLTRQASFNTQMIRHHGRYFHKRSTIDLILRGKMAGGSAAGAGAAAGVDSAQVYSAPHRFEKCNYTTPTYCDYCNHVLWGLVKTGMRCVDCGYNSHEKCVDHVAKNCTKYKAVPEPGGTPGGKDGNYERTSIGSAVASHHHQTPSQQFYDQFSSNVAENRTHEGYLYKRGVLLKSWKQRWFVLDSIKHELRYYDAMEDSHCKGTVNLAEVESVSLVPPAPGAPKKVDDKAFFELRTTKRFYSFCANDGPSAQEWIEKIQACLQ